MEKKVKMIYVITNTDNNQIFFEIAKRIFQKHRNIEIVRILGIGWFIDYRKDLKIINTANDSAIYPQEIEEYKKSIMPVIVDTLIINKEDIEGIA